MLRAVVGLVFGISCALISQAAAETATTYEARGVVKELAPSKKEVVIDHEDIPGYMPSMIMPFTVREPKDLESLHPGDAIAFNLHVTKDDGWIDTIKKTASSTTPTVAKTNPKAPTRLEPLKVGDVPPDFTFTDEQSRPLQLRNYRGQALAFTFIFTRCPYPTFCPLLSNHFATVQHTLATDPTSPPNWQLLSITIDPEHDKPEVLRGYGQRLNSDPARWHFATGTLRDITTLALHCGLGFWEEKGTITHDMRTIVVGADGRIRRIFPDNRWTPSELIAELRLAATAK